MNYVTVSDDFFNPLSPFAALSHLTEFKDVSTNYTFNLEIFSQLLNEFIIGSRFKEDNLSRLDSYNKLFYQNWNIK